MIFDFYYLIHTTGHGRQEEVVKILVGALTTHPTLYMTVCRLYERCPSGSHWKTLERQLTGELVTNKYLSVPPILSMQVVDAQQQRFACLRLASTPAGLLRVLDHQLLACKGYGVWTR